MSVEEWRWLRGAGPLAGSNRFFMWSMYVLCWGLPVWFLVLGGVRGDWGLVLGGLVLLAWFALITGWTTREVVLRPDSGEITARGRLWHRESSAQDVDRLVIRYRGKGRQAWRIILEPRSGRSVGQAITDWSHNRGTDLFSLWVTQTMAIRLLELNPAIEVKDKRLPKDRRTTP